jgi:hypothetical protein
MSSLRSAAIDVMLEGRRQLRTYRSSVDGCAPSVIQGSKFEPRTMRLVSAQDIVIPSMAVLFTVLGWWRFSKRSYGRSYYDDRPSGMSRKEYERRWWRRKNLGRVSVLVLWGVVGALVGMVLTTYLKNWFPGA